MRCLALVLALYFAIPGSVALAQRVALVIGNSDYEVGAPLVNPSTDAQAISDKLEELDFEVRRVVDATLVEMQAALGAFSEEAQGAEIAIIFYAGHGVQVDGRNYLMPVDARVRRRADLDTEGISDGLIWSELLAAEPQVALLILDACRDNPFAGQIGTAAGLATGSISATSFVQRPNTAGMLIGFAAAPGAVAYDGIVGGHSPFTTALLQWIDRPALEIGTMFRRVRGTVLELTRGAQIPWVEDALLREVFLHPEGPDVVAEDEATRGLDELLVATIETFDDPSERSAAFDYFSRLTGDTPEGLVLEAAVVPSGGRQAEREFARQGLIWLSIRDGDEVEVFRRFREAFPDGPFAELAAERIDALTRPAPEPVDTEPLPPDETVAAASPTTPVPADPPAAAAPQIAVEPPDGSRLTFEPVEPEEETGAAPAASEPQEIKEETVAQSGTAGDFPAGDGDVAGRLRFEPPSGTTAPSATAAADPPAAGEDGPPEAEAAAPPPDPAEVEATFGFDRDALRAVQRLLADGGEYRGAIDGLFGPGTRGGIAAFQEAHGLRPTGYLDEATLAALVSRSAGTVLRGRIPDAQRTALHGVAAVARDGAGAAPTVLRVAAISRNDEVHAYWEDLARTFEADHPGVRVVFEHQPDWRYKENLLALLGSPNPPAIVHTWGGGHLDALREAGFVRDLSAQMADGWALEFRPGALQNYRHDGRIYGAPVHLALVSLWVNAPILEQAGVPLEQLQTWDGFLAAIEALKRQGIVPLAISGQDKWMFQMLWGSLALEIGGREALQAMAEGDGDGFRAPPFAQAARRLSELAALRPFPPGFREMTEADAGNAFARGEAAMVVTGNWRLHSMRWNWPGGLERMREEIRRVEFPSPAGAAGDVATYGGADGYAVNAAAPDVAVDLLRLLTSREVQARLAELANDVPSVSAADLQIAEPLLADVATALLDSRYHQLYLDQVVGPRAGAILNDVALRLGTGQIGSEEAVRTVDDAWSEARADLGLGSAPEVARP